MNHDTIVANLTKWMTEFVETPNPLLGNWPPCPYARQARVNNKIEFVYSPHDVITTTVEQNLNKLEDKDVIVVYFDHTMIQPDILAELVKVYNESFLMPRNYVALEDHPDSIEYVNTIQMNFGECGLLIISKLDMLNDASDKLREKGYYKHWNQEELDSVVSWRYK
jgi:hypothetical protein